jgi:hypothetical protein
VTGLPWEMQAEPDPPDDGSWEPPSIGTPGRLIVEIAGVYPCETLQPHYWVRYEIDRTSHGGDDCTFWINEGIGINDWVENYLDLEQPGIYVVENVRGWYVKGDGYTSEDNEEWEFGLVRYATEEEVKEL